MAKSCSPTDLISQFLDNDRERCSLFGRILAVTADTVRPTELSVGRNSTFLFGEDALSAIRGHVISDPFAVLMELGLTSEHVRFKLEAKREKYWLVIFRVEVGPASPVRAYPATWDGVGEIIAWQYPEAHEDFTRHKHILSTHPCDYFEKESGIDFVRCLNLENESDKAFPYFSYSRFLTCPAPRSPCQVRLFLYCELRILEKFTGDGYTLTPDNKKGFKEFIANSFKLSLLPQNQLIITPLEIKSDRIKHPVLK